MTFTLPRLQRPGPATSSPALAPVSTLADVFMEVVFSQGQAQVLPRVPGWQLRLWPTAALGDATLEAHPENPQASVTSLTDALHAQGIQTLGLTRRRARR